MAKPTLDEIWAQAMGGTGTPQMINPQVGSGSFDLNGSPQSLDQIYSASIPQPNFGGTIAQPIFEQPQPKKSLIGKIGSFLGQATGISGTAKALNAPNVALGQQNATTDIVNQAMALVDQAKKLPVGNPKRKQLLAEAKALSSGASALADKSLSDVPTNLQGLGSVGKIGMTIGSFGLGAPATAAGRLGQATLTGGAFGGLDAAEKGLTGKDILKGAGVGAATGLAVGGLMEGIRWAAQNLPKRLMSGVSGLKNQQMNTPKGQKAIQYALDKHKIGTSAQLMKQGQKAIEELDGKISTALAGAKGKVSPLQIAKDIADEMNANGWMTDQVEVFGRIKDMAPNAARFLSKKTLTIPQANDLRKLIDDVIRPSAWLSTQPPANQQFAMSVRRAFSEAVKTAAPETRQMFSDMANELTLLQGLERLAANTGNNKILSLGDLVLGGGGFAGAGPLGAAGAVALNKTLHSTLVNSVAANLVGPISNVLIKLSPQEQQLIVQAISNAYGPKKTQDVK